MHNSSYRTRNDTKPEPKFRQSKELRNGSGHRDPKIIFGHGTLSNRFRPLCKIGFPNFFFDLNRFLGILRRYLGQGNSQKNYRIENCRRGILVNIFSSETQNQNFEKQIRWGRHQRRLWRLILLTLSSVEGFKPKGWNFSQKWVLWAELKLGSNSARIGKM